METPGGRNDLAAGRDRKIGRRTWLAGLGVGAAGVGAGLIYRAAPTFWQQYARELGTPVEAPPERPNPALWPDEGIHAAWLGHATVLLKINGYTVVTDPVFSKRVGLNLGPFTLGLKRMVEPALALEALPKVDAIVLSHAHMDHFDIPTLRAMEDPRVEVVTARGTADLLRADRYARVQEVGWDERVRVGPLTLRGLEVVHWGARMRTDTWRGYNGFLIESGRSRVLYAGDTAMTSAFRNVGGADLALMPIGAYDPWIRNHCSPEQAWRMAEDARADLVIPVHHATFQLSHEPVHEPIERLLGAAGGERERVAVTRIGGEVSLV
jgi:L-ascorbate metabolism protein UlaG (beta-lactamase superfamily)